MGLFAVLLPDTAVRQSQSHLAGLVPSPKLEASAPFRIRVDMQGTGNTASGDPGAAVDDASRSHQQGTLLWEPTGEQLIGGDRLAVASGSVEYADLWELAGPATPHRILGGPLVWTASAYRMADLYPFVGTLRELGGAQVATDIPVNVWQTSPARAETGGAVYDFDGETPFEWFAELAVPNRELAVGSKTYKIVDATRHEVSPRVTLRLRQVRPGG